MKHIQKFENLFRSEYPDMFEPRKPEDEPQDVPGFESGTIDPEDDDIYDNISDKERYETIFLKLVKERNFEETTDEIKINLHKLGQDYCMSIYQATKNLRKFLKDELIGKYITDGFVDVMKDNDVRGIIEDIIFINIDSDCDSLINFKLKNIPRTENTVCQNIITIDKKKSIEGKYNL